jgi:hypothetical protein
MSRTILGRTLAALDQADSMLTHLMDIGGVPDNSPVDREIQAALVTLYGAVRAIKAKSRRQAQLTEEGPLVFPVRGRDMRFWKMSDGRVASALLPRRKASRYASARTVKAGTSVQEYRVMTASQYLKALEDAVITDYSRESNRDYEKFEMFTDRGREKIRDSEMAELFV